MLCLRHWEMDAENECSRKRMRKQAASALLGHAVRAAVAGRVGHTHCTHAPRTHSTHTHARMTQTRPPSSSLTRTHAHTFS